MTYSTKRSKGPMPFCVSPRPKNIQPGNVGPGAASIIFVLDLHGTAGAARASRVFAATTCLNAGFLVGGDHKLVVLKRRALPCKDGLAAPTNVANPPGIWH
jgi:hypothetical protein